MSRTNETSTAVVDSTTVEKPVEDTAGEDTAGEDTAGEDTAVEDTAGEAAAVTTAERPARAGRFSPRLPLPVTITVAAVLVVALAAAVAFGALLARKAATDRSGAEALATAKAYAITVTSYDYQNLDRNFADVLDGATGEFKDQYSGASQTLRQLIANAKATAKGTVLGAGISSASTDQVVVVVFVDQLITNAATAQPRIDRNRVEMTLATHDGRWLVSKLELM